MKSKNHRSQHLTATGIGTACPETPEPEKLCCPEVDYNGSGNLNMPVHACRLRAQYRDQRRCYGARPIKNADGTWRVQGCQGRRPVKYTMDPQAYAKNVAANRRRAQRSITHKRADDIVAMYTAGHPVNIIAKHMGCGHATVSNILRAAGITMRPQSIRAKIYDYLNNSPNATLAQVQNLFDCTAKTAEIYYYDWRGLQKRKK